MWPLLIGLLLIIGILLVLFFFRGKNKPNAITSKKGKAGFSGKRPAIPDRLPSASGVLNQEPGVPDQSEDLKKILREGITRIFSMKPSLDHPGAEALRLEALDPEVLRLAREQIRNLKDFRKT